MQDFRRSSSFRRLRWSLWLAAGVGGAVAMVGAATDVPLTRADGDRLLEKTRTILLHGITPANEARLTPVTQTEVNAYLKFQAADQLPAGVQDPSVEILGEGRVSGRAIVDLEEFQSRAAESGDSSSVLSPLSFLGGRLPVSSTAVLRSGDGTAQLELVSVEVAGVPVPISMLEELVGYYTSTPDNPEGLDLNAPFPLPANIVEIRVGEGEAVIVQ